MLSPSRLALSRMRMGNDFDDGRDGNWDSRNFTVRRFVHVLDHIAPMPGSRPMHDQVLRA